MLTQTRVSNALFADGRNANCYAKAIRTFFSCPREGKRPLRQILMCFAFILNVTRVLLFTIMSLRLMVKENENYHFPRALPSHCEMVWSVIVTCDNKKLQNPSGNVFKDAVATIFCLFLPRKK